MMISPIIFCTIVLGIGSVRKAAQVGKVGGLALGYFLVMSTVALAIGLVVGNIIHPGAGLHLDRGSAHDQVPAAEGPSGRRLPARASSRPRSSPPLTGGNVLQTLLVALLVGFALQAMGRTGEPVLRGDRLPPAAGLPGPGHDHVGRADRRVRRDRRRGRRRGLGALKSLASLMVGFYITCALFVFVVLGTLLQAGHRRQHPPAAALPRPRVPADPVDLVVGVGAAAADREDGAPRRRRARSSASPCRPATRSTSTAPRST